MENSMRFQWNEEYNALAEQFLELHFSGASGLTTVFPCMRENYPWASHRPDVVDSQIPAKNNTEYHGLEVHASQYHATAQYEFAYHYWLLAAFWRRADAIANSFEDEGHSKAVSYCLKQAMYNKALYVWQKEPSSATPTPEQFELTSSDIDKKEQKAWNAIGLAPATGAET